MNDREIKYLLTGDASKIKQELASVEKAAEQAGKSIDRALTNAFKGSANSLTAEFAKNLDTITKGLNAVQKGTQNAFNTQSVAEYAKRQSTLANELQKLDQQYKTLSKTANDYRQTLIRTGADASTAASITDTWARNQTEALQKAGRAISADLGSNFGGIAALAPTLAAGIKQIDDESAESEKQVSRLSKALEGARTQLDKIHAKNFSEQSKSILEFGNNIRKSTADLSRMALGLAAAIAVFASVPIIKTISLIESAELGLESLLQSTEAAGKAIFDLYTFANATPYDTSSLIAYEQKLVSVGLTGQQAFGVIQRVSDIGGAFGASADQLDRFYYVLSQIFGAGKATGTDFLQIQNSLPGFISAIGNAMGKSAGEVRAAFGDGSVTSQVIVKALNDLTKEGGIAFQGAIKQSSTFAGILNNLQDNLKRVGMAFFGVTITTEGMQVAVDGLYSRLKGLMSAILEFVENPLVVEVFVRMGSAVGAILSTLEQYPQLIAIITGLFLAFASDLISRIPFIGNLIGEIGYGTGALVGLFGALVVSSQEVQRALLSVVAIAIDFVQRNQSLFVQLLANFQELLQVIGQGVAPALIIAARLFFDLAQAVIVALNAIIQTATAIANFLGPAFTQAITLGAGFLAIGYALTPVVLAAASAIRVLGLAAVSTAGRIAIVIAAVVALISILTSLFGATKETSPIESLSGIFDSITDSSANTTAGIDNVTGALGGAGDAAKKATKQLAAFDKMNVINSPTDSGAGAGGGGGLGDLGITEPVLPDFNKLKENLKNALAGLQEVKPKANWWDFLIIPGGILALWSLLAQYIKNLPGPIMAVQLAFLKLKDIASKVIGTIAPAILNSFKNIGPALAKFFTSLGPRLAAIFAQIGPAVGRALATIGPVIIRAIPTILRALLTGLSTVVKFLGPVGLAIGLALTALIELIFNWDTVSKWFTNVWNGIVTWFQNLGTQIGAIFMQALQGAFGPIPQIFASIVVVIVAVVATIIQALGQLPGWIYTNVIQPIGAFFANLWGGIQIAFILMWSVIQQVFGMVAGWVNTNVIQPVAGFFAGLWSGIVQGAQTVWNGVVQFFSPIFNWINNTIIQPIARAFSGLWSGIVNAATGIFSKIVTALSPIFNWINNNVVVPIQNVFNRLGEAIKQVFQNVATTAANIFNGIVSVVKGVFNGIIDAINKVIDSINKIKVPKEVPGLGGLSPNFPRIPRLAKGGIVDNATLAMIGEDGREAVMPLENNTGWIEELASKLGDFGGSQQPTVVNVYLDGNKVGGAISNSINDRTMVTGVNQIYV